MGKKGEFMQRTIEEWRKFLGVPQEIFVAMLDMPLNTYRYQAKTNNFTIETLDTFCKVYKIKREDVDLQRKGK